MSHDGGVTDVDSNGSSGPTSEENGPAFRVLAPTVDPTEEIQQRETTKEVPGNENQGLRPAISQPEPASPLSSAAGELRPVSAVATSAGGRSQSDRHVSLDSEPGQSSMSLQDEQQNPDISRPSGSTDTHESDSQSENEDQEDQESEDGHHENEDDNEVDNDDDDSDENGDDDQSLVAMPGSCDSSLDSAWVKISTSDGSRGYRHPVTGEVYLNNRKIPQKTGPAAHDIPEGWTARLESTSKEKWVYVHSATKTIIKTPPRSLSEAVTKEFDVAASHGAVPQHCQGHLEDGSIIYKINNPSRHCPRSWRTFKHPNVIEADLQAYLAAYNPSPSKPAKAILLTPGGHVSQLDLGSSNVAAMSGILLIEDIDNVLISSLCAAFAFVGGFPFFVLCHLLLRRLHSTPGLEELETHLLGWWWMSHRGPSDKFAWLGSHHDTYYDHDQGKTHFSDVQIPDSHRAIPPDLDVVRLSMLDVYKHLTVILIGDARFDCMKRQLWFHNIDPATEIVVPAFWVPSVPVYLCLDGLTATGLRPYLIRLLGVTAKRMADAMLPRASDETHQKAVFAYDGNNVMYLLAVYMWKDGFELLSQELEYFWEQAIRGPDVDDFSRLKASRKYVERLYRDFGLWLAQAGTDLQRPDREKLRDEMEDLREQILNMKQEISDTFQLLIGAINIKDSEIQKKLARDSKKQARRSTALTALAAIYLPLSLTTGVFGMNISEISSGNAPRYWAVLALSLGLLVATLPFLLWIFLDKDDDDEISEGRRKSVGSHPGGNFDVLDQEKNGISRRSTARQGMVGPGDFLRRRRPTSPHVSHDNSQKGPQDVTKSTAHPEHMV